jgi:hypothetical protein
MIRPLSLTNLGPRARLVCSKLSVRPGRDLKKGSLNLILEIPLRIPHTSQYSRKWQIAAFDDSPSYYDDNVAFNS